MVRMYFVRWNKHHLKFSARQLKDSQIFHGGPVARTPHFQCRGPGSDPWSVN